MGQLGILGATIKGQFGFRMSVVVMLYSCVSPCILLHTLVYLLVYCCILLCISLYTLVHFSIFLHTFICRVWLCWCFFCGIWAYCKGGGEVRDEGGCRGEGWRGGEVRDEGGWRDEGWRGREVRDGGGGGVTLRAGNNNPLRRQRWILLYCVCSTGLTVGTALP